MKKTIYTLLLLLAVCQVADAKKIKKKSQHLGNKSQLTVKEQWPNFIDNFFDWLASPWRPVWGEFKIDGQNTTAPMALFQSNTFASDLAMIKTKVSDINNKDFHDTYEDLYEKIFDNHTPKSLVYTIDANAQSAISTWCKNAAFVYLIGLKPDGTALSSTQLTFLKDNVLNEMRYAYTRYGSNDTYFKGGDWDDVQIWRSKELVCYLSAYELMRAAGATPEELFNPRDGLANVATELYKQATKPFSTLSKALNNNITGITCSALLMSGIILHDRLTTYFNRRAKPENWANKSFVLLNETMFTGTIRQTEEDGNRGFKEAGGYFAFLMETLVPAMVTYNNFVDNKPHSKIYNEPVDLDWGSIFSLSFLNQLFSNEIVNNYKYDLKWNNLISNYVNTLMPNGKPPTIDDTDLSKAIPHLAALKIANCSVLNGTNLQNALSDGFDARADFLAANNTANSLYAISEANYFNYKSGELVLRNKDFLNNYHYLHLLGEKNTNTDKAYYYLNESINEGHENSDLSSFIIGVSDGINFEHLAIDPPYLGYTSRNETNKAEMHNLIKINNKFPMLWDNPINQEGNNFKKSVKQVIEYTEPFSPLTPIMGNTSFSFSAPFSSIANIALYTFTSFSRYTSMGGNAGFLALGNKKQTQATLSREITTEDDNGNLYYLMIDECKSNESITNHQFVYNLNGNGNFNENTFNDSELNDGKVRFYNPCNKNRSWGLKVSTISLTNNGNITYDKVTTYKNTNIEKDYIANTQIGSVSNTGKFGEHTTFKATKTGTNSTQIFQTVLMPYKCTDISTGLGKGAVIRNLFNSEYAATIIDSLEPDWHQNLHVIKSSDFDSITIINPFLIDSNSEFKTNAEKSFLSYCTNANIRFGCCVAKSNFRAASIENGDTLIYNDTLFIKSNLSISEAKYRLVGKYKYQGYVKSAGDAAVSFFLPDLDTSFRMKASADTLMYYYDVNTHEMTLFVKEGITYFVFELDDQCALNCYFPPTIDSVRTTFNFNNGLVEALPHKLTITTPNGLLKIENGSTMSICPGNWLRNTDSLIMENRCINENSKPGIVKCYNILNPERAPTIKAIGQGGGGRPSTIIVNEQAALILDTGSYTRVGNNCTITIKSHGTLIIRENAKLDIGDDKSCGYALIVCHDNSYVHIENNADLKFWKIDNDTNDKQYFYIVLNPSWDAAKNDIEPSIKTMLLNIDTNIVFGTPVPICNLSTIKAPHGINNRDWGWANFGKPKAWARLPKLTFCPGECPEIDFGGMLNNVGTQISFYRIDTSYVGTPHDSLVPVPNPYYNVGGTTSNCDTFTDLPFLKLCHSSLIVKNKWYKVKIKIANECYEEDSIDLHYFMLKDVDASFTINKAICIDSVVAIENTDTFTRLNRENTLWHVHYMDSTNSALNTQKINYGGDWEYEGNNYPTNFKFPGFKWVGGFYYAVSHTVNYKGCNSKTVWDTIFVAPGANITFGRPITYGQHISGNQSVQLKGYVTNADSFNWNPTTWLDTATSLTPISTPVDNITYILSAYKDGCVARDTANIKYNRYANAGYNDTLCLDSSHNTTRLLGFPYDMSLFLGMLYYYDNSQFMSYYNNHNAVNTPDYFRYFTHFMHTQEFADAASGCSNNLYELFTNTVQKDLFLKKPWYINYYTQFTQHSNSNLNGLAIFNSQVNNTPELKNHLDSLTNWANIDACINEILNQYDTYALNYQSSISNVKWTKTPNLNTALLNTWDNYFLAVDAPTESTKYTFSVITPDRAEIDEITILVDTTLTPLFAPGMQFDSTVFFMNYTEPISTATTYEWNFGDGSANSNEQNPIHTFPAFDTSFIVCLTASNKCNSWQYCDTVFIDSLHLGGTLKTANKPAFFESNNQQPSDKINGRSALGNKPEARSQELIALQNYPNPFNQSTIIDYQIWQSFSQAELHITNVLGQVLYTQKLQKPIDKVEIDGSNLANGLYYYSIVVDNNIKLTKTMSVIH